LALNALALIFAGQTWWALSINTGDQTTEVVGTGFDADKSISAILLFSLAALLFVAFSRGWPALVISTTAAAATTLLTVTTTVSFLNENIGGITEIVEKHTGFAVGSHLKLNEPAVVTGELQLWAWLTIATLIALAICQAYFAFSALRWARESKPKSNRSKYQRSNDDGQDPISLWDGQRT
jgi:cobalamin synthase